MSRLNKTLNQDLEALDKWLRGNKPSLNVAKAQSMIIYTIQKLDVLKGQNDKINLRIRHKYLDGVECTRYLGVHIDNALD